MKAMAIEILSENPTVTLKDLNAILRTRMPEKPRVPMRTLANALDGLAYTVKLSRDVPADRNRPDVKDDRYEYARWLTNSDIVNTKKVYVDEFGVNIHTKRNEGRSVRGTRAYQTVSGAKRMKCYRLFGNLCGLWDSILRNLQGWNELESLSIFR